MTRQSILILSLFLIAAAVPAQGPRRISEDRDLKAIDITAWDCRNMLEGTAKTADGQERNRGKNRSATDITTLRLQDFSIATFIQSVAQFDALTANKRRKDLSPAEQQQLGPLEKEIVQVTGYLGVAYVGPPETCNCGSVDFHDWHLEIFEKPIERPPQPGDTTPIICEVTPRTQNAIFGDNVRVQELAAFFRRADLTYESTGHPARKIKLIGYRLWDDDHNGRADVGTTVKKQTANGYHQPWRQTAWEIHPVIKIIPLEPPMPAKNAPAPTPPSIVASPSPTPETSAPGVTPAETLPTPTATPMAIATPPPQPQIVTITKAVPIHIPYGQIVLQPGTKLPFVSRDAQSVTVRYMGEKYQVPLTSTDLK
ncbi:MAG TPA: hypothetical protein VJ719_00045 [Chthoniobacterales bacterium]|nr:hypothetical protein [Chthoniobacterales bacterium]